MPGASSPVEGTGLLGSLRYSSNPVSVGALHESLPLASRYNERATAFFGGHAAKRCHSFRPVSNRKAFGTSPSAEAFSPLPLPLRFCMNNASSMFSWKYSAVLEWKFRFPNVSPRSRAHPPWGPRPPPPAVGGRAPLFSHAV